MATITLQTAGQFTGHRDVLRFGSHGKPTAPTTATVASSVVITPAQSNCSVVGTTDATQLASVAAAFSNTVRKKLGPVEMLKEKKKKSDVLVTISSHQSNHLAKENRKSSSHVAHHPNGAAPKLPSRLGLKHIDPTDGSSNMKSSVSELVLGGHGIVFGTRIPKHYFLVKGFGETDQGDGSDPWETGSYDLALEDAGIQDLNITQYSSVIPPEAETVTLEEAKPFLRHGAVMESIMARMQGVKGDRITAGVGRMQIRRKEDKFHIGGYAAEYSGHASEEVAKTILAKDLTAIFERRFDSKEYEIFEEDYIVQEGEVRKAFGSVLASICFVTYVLPMYTTSN
ncbi:unnamed protein product [Sphagnum compactum]